MDELSLRRRVGAGLILVLGAAATAVLGLSGRPLGLGHRFFVEVEQIGDLKTGSALKIAGRSIGMVTDFRFGASGRVQVEVFVEANASRHVHRNSELFISSVGVIGERFLEVGPPRGAADGPPVRAGDIVRGVDPPRLDRMLQTTYQNLKQITDLLREVAPLMQEFLVLSDRINARMQRLEGEPGRLRAIWERSQRALDDGRSTLSALREATDDFDRVRALGTRLDALADRTAPDARAVRDRLDRVMDGMDRLAALVPAAERRRLAEAFDRFSHVATALERLQRDALVVAARVEAGEGTIGGLMQDLEIFDDIKIMHKVMKDRPWRILVKPWTPKKE